MLECLIIGDSIAQGIANVRSECVDYAHSGYNSHRLYTRYKNKDLSYDTVVISLGTNDYQGIDTYKDLSNLRKKINSNRVFWIVPANVNSKSGITVEHVRSIIKKIATTYNDTLVYIPKPTSDRYHPTGKGYRQMAKETR